MNDERSLPTPCWVCGGNHDDGACMRCPHGVSNAGICWACNPDRQTSQPKAPHVGPFILYTAPQDRSPKGDEGAASNVHPPAAAAPIDRGACSLKEMCEADRQDAERYRWLRRNGASIMGDETPVFVGDVQKKGIIWRSMETLDQGIDAATVIDSVRTKEK